MESVNGAHQVRQMKVEKMEKYIKMEPNKSYNWKQIKMEQWNPTRQTIGGR